VAVEPIAPPPAAEPDKAAAGSFAGSALLFGLLLAVACLLVYQATFTFELLTWDDDQHVTNNEHFQPLTWRSFTHFWAYSHIYLYIPISYNFYGLEVFVAQFFPTGDPNVPLNPAVFHVGNVLVHLGCTLLAYRILLKLVRHEPAAFLGAALFCFHPFQAESVSWVGESRGTLATFFSFAAINLYLRWAGVDPERGIFAERAYEPPVRRRRDYWFALTCFAAALLSKPSAAACPAIVLVIDVVLLRRRTRTALWHLLPWLILAVADSALTKYYQRDSHIFALAIAPLERRPLIAGDAYAFYLKKLVWPFDMAFDYGRTPQMVAELPEFYRAWLLPAVVGLGLALLPRRRIWLGCYAIFLVALLPVSGLVPFIYQAISTVADRYMYVPMLGFALLLAAWIASREHRALPIAVAAAAVGLMVPRTIEQCRTWRDDWTLYRHGIAVTPLSYMANLNLGFRYRQDKQYDKAIEHFLRVAEIRPDYFWGNYHAGTCYLALKKYDDAIREFRTAHNIRPDAVESAIGLGDVYKALRDWPEAERWYRIALKYAPDQTVPHLALGELLVARDRYAEADQEFLKAQKLAPESADVPRRYGRALLDAEQYAQAAPWLERWAALEPDDAEPQVALSHCFYALSKFALAEAHGAAAVARKPGLFEARHNYALALAAVGKSAAAREQFEAALAQTAPGSASAAEIRKALDSLQ
jgi:tetratricopeptide (TPR) repeat protein